MNVNQAMEGSTLSTRKIKTSNGQFTVSFLHLAGIKHECAFFISMCTLTNRATGKPIQKALKTTAVNESIY